MLDYLCHQPIKQLWSKDVSVLLEMRRLRQQLDLGERLIRHERLHGAPDHVKHKGRIEDDEEAQALGIVREKVADELCLRGTAVR